MKKIFAVLLITAIVFSFASCAQTEEVQTVPEFNTENDFTDLSGCSIRFSSDYQKNSATVLRYDRDTLFSDLALQRIEDVEKQYNCKIVPVDVDFGGSLALSVAANMPICDVAFLESWALVNNGLIKGGLILPISVLSDYIDYKDAAKWGNRNQLQGLVWDNELYGVAPMSWPEYFLSSCDFALVVNEDYIHRLGEQDPREYVEDGSWTREKFSEVVKRYNFTGNSNEQIYGLTFLAQHFFDMSLRANGVEYAVKEGENWKSGLHTPEAENALQWANEFVYLDGKDYVKTQDTYSAINMFVDGGATMLLTHMGFAFDANNNSNYKSIVYNVENFGVLPFPLGPNKDYGEWAGQYESLKTTLTFPVNSDEPEAAAIAMSAVFEPLPGFETQESLIEYYTQYMFHDVRDAQVIFKMLENCRYTFYADGARAIVDILGGSLKTVSEVLEANKESYIETMNESIVPVYQSSDFLWG